MLRDIAPFPPILQIAGKRVILFSDHVNFQVQVYAVLRSYINGWNQHRKYKTNFKDFAFLKIETCKLLHTVQPPVMKEWVGAYGRWSFTWIKPHGAFTEKRYSHIYFMENNFLKVVLYLWFQLLGFDWENFGVLDWRSIIGGGRTWRFDCIVYCTIPA